MKVQKKENNIIISGVVDFNLEQTLECGQCFHFLKLEHMEYAVSACNRLLRIRQDGDDLILFDTTLEEYEQIWKKYFDLERDYGRIKCDLLSMDDKLKEAIETMNGVRILNQEFFEILISFIISQNKQIVHIKKIVNEVSKRFGTYLGQIAGEEFYAFPTPQQLACASEQDLRDCKAGFRAPYICDAVQKVCSGIIDEKMLHELSYEECEQYLLQIKGVGTKVANCVMLFGLGKREAFPVDVWIKRVMEVVYFEGEDTPKEKIQTFAQKRFGSYGGYAQQYLFYFGKTERVGTKY